MKRELFLAKNITELGLNSKITQTLIDNNIDTIRLLWELNRKKLKSFSLTDSEINQITIKLQLKGLDLNKKVY